MHVFYAQNLNSIYKTNILYTQANISLHNQDYVTYLKTSIWKVPKYITIISIF